MLFHIKASFVPFSILWLRRARELSSSVLEPFFESRACSGVHTD
jgi:hypothetical protein